MTQTGALNRGFVREVAERWPGWWAAEIFGPPHRETDVTPLMELHELLRALRIIRRRGSQVTTTKKGRSLQANPPALLQLLTNALIDGDSFDAACAELTAALLIAGTEVDYSDAIPGRDPADARD